MRNLERMSKACEDIQQAIIAKNLDLAISIIRSSSSYYEAELFAHAVLAIKQTPRKVLNEALEQFLNVHQNDFKEHLGWIHSLSHFDSELWMQRATHWIKILYEVAFKGKHKTKSYNYNVLCESLVYNFDYHSKWFDDPTDFHIRLDNIPWFKWNNNNKHIRARINHGPFESEEAFIYWKFLNPSSYIEFDSDSQRLLLSISKMRADILRIAKIKSDVYELLLVERRLINNQLWKLERQLKKSNNNWEKDRLNNAISKMKWLLGKD